MVSLAAENPDLAAYPLDTRASPSGTIQLFLLNGFEVECGEDRIQFPAVGSRLIAYLALQQRPIARCALAGALWPETTQEKAQASLRSALWRVRLVNDQIVQSTHECLKLGDQVEVDVHDLLEAAQRLERGLEPRGIREVEASRFAGELLPDWYEDWVAFERERFRLMALHALERLSAWRTGNGDFAAAVELALAAVRLEPLRESARRALMEAHLAQGNVSEALRQYRDYRRFLMQELGLPPSEHMVILLESAGLSPAAVDVA